ncbi:unnamed protein product [Mortierella alpina]
MLIYSGASSTHGENMMLDMSKAYIDLDRKNQDRTLVEVGVSLALGQLNPRLKNAIDSCRTVSAPLSIWEVTARRAATVSLRVASGS